MLPKKYWTVDDILGTQRPEPKPRPLSECFGYPEPLPVLAPANDNHVQVGTWPRVVGLQGYGGSGKSEVRRILEKRGYVARHIKEPIVKRAVEYLRDLGVPEEMIPRYLDGDLKRSPIPELGVKSGTELQQDIGEYGRSLDPDIWLRNWSRWADAQLGSGGAIVQESVRHLNEAGAVRARGGVVLEIRRPGVGPVNGHVSEALPTTPDYVVENTGTLDELESKVITAMEMLG